MRLLHRTTHGLSLTDEGDTFLRYSRCLLDTTAELDSELSGKLSGPPDMPITGHTRTDNSALLLSLVLQGVGIDRINDLYGLPKIRACIDYWAQWISSMADP